MILLGDRLFRQLLFDDLQLMTLDERPSDLDGNYDSAIMPFVSEHARRPKNLD